MWIISNLNSSEYLEPVLRSCFRSIENHSVDELMGYLAKATIVEPGTVPGLCGDSHDEMFLAAALTARAEAIVSEDLDLLSLGNYEGIVICNSQTIIDLLGATDGR